jgi:hypothetical protein
LVIRELLRGLRVVGDDGAFSVRPGPGLSDFD